MLASVSLTNFMAHRNLTVDLDPVFTVVRGPNRAGKSCIVRALDWALYGGGPSWSDDEDLMELLHQGADRAAVKVVWADGKIAERTRQGRRQELHLGDQVYTSGVADWPEEIAKYCGFQLVDLGGEREHVNLAFQDEPCFIIDWSPERVDKALGRMTGAEDLENATAETLKLQRAASDSQKRLAALIETLTGRLAAFEGLEEAAAICAEGEALVAESADAQTRHDQIAVLLAALDRLPVVGAEPLQAAAKALDEAHGLLDAAESASLVASRVDYVCEALEALPSQVPAIPLDTLEAAAGLLRQAEECERRAGAIEMALRTLPAPAPAAPDLSALADSVQVFRQLEQLEGEQSALDSLLSRLDALDDTLAEAAAGCEQAEQDAADADAGFQQALVDSGACPLCGQETKGLGHEETCAGGLE